jgi:ATP-dependent RNA helicase DeaD
LSDTDNAQVFNNFGEFGLRAPIIRAIESLGYEQPTQIQARSIPVLLEGQDLLGQAQTGTGKTAAFALPLLDKIDIKSFRPQALVLAPTRELALQVCEAIQRYGRHLDKLAVLPVYGGQGMGAQLKALRRGVHVVVGTPGRLLDHLERGTLRLDEVRMLVLDEADEMLRMGFIEEVEKILERTPENRQTALFSATMPGPIARIAGKFLRDPQEVRIASKAATVEAIDQQVVLVSGERNKVEALTRILEVEDFDGMIIFVRTRVTTTALAERLEARGHGAFPLNGDMTQQLRQRTVDRFKDGDFDILVCTDVAARGLDVPRISHVVNYDIPSDTEAYVHRVGRTGRAGRGGKAILFAGRREQRMLQAIERATRTKISKLTLPTGGQIGQRRIAAFKQLVAKTADEQELDYFRAIVDGFCDETGYDASTLAAALAYLYQRERPFEIRDVQIEDREQRPRDKKKQGPRDNQERGPRKSQSEHPLVTYKVKVGHEHGLEPRHLVGAIANEAGLESQYIGAIRIGEHRSTVQLPAGMPEGVLAHLKKVWVCGVQLQMTIQADGEAEPSRPSRPGKGRGKVRDSKASKRPRTDNPGKPSSSGKPKKPARPADSSKRPRDDNEYMRSSDHAHHDAPAQERSNAGNREKSGRGGGHGALKKKKRKD